MDTRVKPAYDDRVAASALSAMAGNHPIPTISCINNRPAPQALGHCGPIWYPASAASDRHPGPAAPRLTGCGGGADLVITPSNPSAQNPPPPHPVFTAPLTPAQPATAPPPR